MKLNPDPLVILEVFCKLPACGHVHRLRFGQARFSDGLGLGVELCSTSLRRWERFEKDETLGLPPHEVFIHKADLALFGPNRLELTRALVYLADMLEEITSPVSQADFTDLLKVVVRRRPPENPNFALAYEAAESALDEHDAIAQNLLTHPLFATPAAHL